MTGVQTCALPIFDHLVAIGDVELLEHIGGYAPDIELQADDLRHVRDTVLGIIAEQTGQPPERVFDDSLRDHVFTADEAIAYGFVDHLAADLTQIRPLATAATGFGVNR